MGVSAACPGQLFPLFEGEKLTPTNNNWPHGFRPLMVDAQGAPVGINQYAKPASDTNQIFTWDLVRKVAGSQVTEGKLRPDAACQTFATGTPGTTLILGATLNGGKPSAATWHAIVDDPNALFEAQCDGSTAITVASAAGKNANVNNTAQSNGLPNAVSVMQVASATIAATAGLDVRIRDLHYAATNVEGANALVEVLILKHQNANGSAGV